MDDSQIINLYFARDENAIVETKNKYQNMCYIVAHNILYSREDSEECVNDTWLRTWNTIPPSRPSVLSTFLAKIVRNLSLNRYRDMHALKRGGSSVNNNKKYSNRPLSEKKCAETGGFTYGRYCWGSGKNWKCNFF
mgnify:CR=1 FL=1